MSLSESDASTSIAAVWFSATEAVADELITGAEFAAASLTDNDRDSKPKDAAWPTTLPVALAEKLMLVVPVKPAFTVNRAVYSRSPFVDGVFGQPVFSGVIGVGESE